MRKPKLPSGYPPRCRTIGKCGSVSALRTFVRQPLGGGSNPANSGEFAAIPPPTNGAMDSVKESVRLPNRPRHCCSISCKCLVWALCAFMPFVVKRATLIRDELDSTNAYPRLARKPIAIAIASFETPERRGNSRTGMPSPSRTRTALALIASDNSDLLSYSSAKARSTRRQQHGQSGLNRGCGLRRLGSVFCRVAVQAVSKNRQTIG